MHLLKSCPTGQVCRGGSITFKSRFTPGRVAVPGQENDEVVTKHVSGFPNYDMESYQKKGTSSERTRSTISRCCRRPFGGPAVWLAGFVQRFKCERGREKLLV